MKISSSWHYKFLAFSYPKSHRYTSLLVQAWKKNRIYYVSKFLKFDKLIEIIRKKNEHNGRNLLELSVDRIIVGNDSGYANTYTQSRTNLRRFSQMKIRY